MVKVIIDPETREVLSYHNEPGEAPEEEEMPETQAMLEERSLEARKNQPEEDNGPVVAAPSCPEGYEEIELPGYTRESLSREAGRKAGGPPGRMRLKADKTLEADPAPDTPAGEVLAELSRGRGAKKDADALTWADVDAAMDRQSRNS